MSKRKPRQSPAPPAPTWLDRAAALPVGLLPALAAVAIFARTVTHGAIFDDEWTLGRLDDVSNKPIEVLLRSGRSVTYLSHRLDQWIWGGATWGSHLTNVLLHGVAAALVAVLAQRLTTSRRVGVLCGLLFAVHPVHVEAVASIAYRKDVLAMIFGAAALSLWVGSSRPWLRYPGVVLALALALFSKEVAAVGVVPMLFLADLLPRGGDGAERPRLRRALLRSAPFLVAGAAAAFLFASHITLDKTFDAIHHESNERIDSYVDVLATALAAVPDVGRLLLWPATLSVDWPIEVQTELFAGPTLVGTALLLAWIAAAVVLVRRAPYIAFALAWVLITWLPASNFVPLTHFFVAERYLYVPSFGICLLAALAVERLVARPPKPSGSSLRSLAVGAAAVLVVAGGARSFVQAGEWRDGHRLWTSALRAGFETRRIHGNIAKELFNGGRREESLAHYQRAWQVHPCTEEALYLAQALDLVGRKDAAAQQCRAILQHEPGNLQARKLLKRLEREGAAAPPR